jgi:transcriptional regulator with XRE-family HTH domain
MTQPVDWSATVAQVVAREVRRYRQMRGLSAQQLADRTADLGMPIQRSVLANLESGRRTTVTVAELLVLSAALTVAPVLLVFPVGREAVSSFLPNESASTWSAARWFGGSGDLPSGEEPSYRAPVELSSEHDDILRRFAAADARAESLRKRSKTENGNIAAVLQDAEAVLHDLERSLADVQARAVREEVVLPSVSPRLAQRIGEAGGDR